MKLWLISQEERGGYDTYDSAVVAAETEEYARGIHPASQYSHNNRGSDLWKGGDWASLRDNVRATLLGDAVDGTTPGVICASFNAG